jgi:hypothetical protein
MFFTNSANFVLRFISSKGITDCVMSLVFT